MVILVDVDGVVADLHTEWLARYNRDYKDELKSEQITGWSIHKFVVNACGTKIYEYLKDPTLYRNVQEIKGASEGIRKLRKIGHEIVFVSSGFYPAKIKWLVDKGFAVDMPTGGNWESVKDVVITGRKDLIRGDIMIDDYPGNLEGFDGVRLMYDSPWNWDEGRFRRVFDWENIYKVIRDEYTYKNAIGVSALGFTGP